MWPDRVSNQGPLTYESGVLPIALCGQAINCKCLELYARITFYTIYWLLSNSDASLQLQTEV